MCILAPGAQMMILYGVDWPMDPAVKPRGDSFSYHDVIRLDRMIQFGV